MVVDHSSLPQDNGEVAEEGQSSIFQLEAILKMASMVPQEPVASDSASASHSCSCGAIAVHSTD